MAIADVSNAEKGWIDAHDVIQRVITEVNAEVPVTEVMPNQADSVAADVPALVVDFNLLLDKLKAAGLMVVDV
jgi:hypothetical protein